MNKKHESTKAHMDDLSETVQKLSLPIFNELKKDKWTPIEKLAILKMIIIGFELTADMIVEKITDPEAKSKAELVRKF